MSLSNEVRYTARSITPPAESDSSPPPKRRAASPRSPPLPPPPPFPPKGVRTISSGSPPPSRRHGRSPSPKRRGRSPSPKRRGRSRSRSRSRNRSPSRSRDEERNPGNNLYVTGLSTRTSSEDLEKFFSKEGKVQDCHIVLDPRTKEPRGFAFVTMENVEDARRCIKYLHRTVLEGRLISVEKAKRTRERTPTPGEYCGRRGICKDGPGVSVPRNRSRSRSGDEERNPGNNLYVTGLSTRTSSEDLEKFFSKEGKVQDCHIVIDPRTKEPRGFAFVTMENVEDARRCIKYLHRTVLEGRLISVEKAKRARERTPTPGEYCGPRGGRARRSPSARRSSRGSRDRSSSPGGRRD